MRESVVERSTRETNVKVRLNLDGTGKHKVNARLNFLNHMLRSFALHGVFDLEVEAEGDVHVDDHHLVEDVGIAIGQSILQASSQSESTRRFASVIVPMDEVLVMMAVDLSGRFHFESNLTFKRVRLGDVSSEMIEHFLKSLAENGRFNLHLVIMKDGNDHHKCEAVFKALGLALAQAVELIPRLSGKITSEKGVL